MRPFTIAGCFSLLLLAVTAPLASAAPGVVATPFPPDVVTPEQILKLIHVPEGFTVELVAAAPLVEHPVMADFDERGRLFVAESAGMNLKAADLLKDPPSCIRLLEDTQGAGRFDKATTFADKMVFPQGVCWVDGALYTASPPSLWQLRDTKGAGIADQRREIVTSFGFTGNAADIHGPVRGPDGYLYWCDGRHGHHIAFPDGKVSEGLAARIFRCRPDGSGVEVVCGGGMDNPTKIAFTAEGEALCGVNLIHSKPKRIDGIIYALEGANFPYYQKCVDEFKTTGPLFEPVDNLGWVAVSGIVRNRGSGLGEAYRDNLFSCQFNPHRVQRHIVQRDGAGFHITHEDFLTCSHPDFHPTDIIEDADGSLILVNTGGWFRIGCPNSQIAKPDVKGAIYRIRRIDAPRVDDPRGLKLAWETMKPAELVRLLDDPRIFVQDRAIARLAKLRAESIPELKTVLENSPSENARRNAVWAMTRINSAEVSAPIRAALADKSPSVRQSAVSSIALRRDADATSQLMGLITSDTPPIRREAATALGRIGRHDAVPALLAALKAGNDRFLEHAVIFALIRLDDRDATLKALSDANPIVRRGALIALDQMDHGGLTPSLVSPLLASPEPVLQSTAAQVIARHSDWGSAMEGYFRQSLARGGLSDVQREELKQQITAFIASPGIEALVVQGLHDTQTPVQMRVLLLEAIAQASVNPSAKPWADEIAFCIDDASERVARQAVLIARAAPENFFRKLFTVIDNNQRSPELRIEASIDVAPVLLKLPASIFELLLESLQPGKPALLRAAAADAMGRAHLAADQQIKLTATLGTAGPLEMPGLLAAFEHGTDPDVGKKLVAAIERSPASRNLRPELVMQALASYPPEVQQAAEPLLKRLSGDVLQQKAHLDALGSALAGGDALRGRELFFGNKATCSACHAVADEGAHVGPDLSKIGAIRTSRDLLESIVYPSASFARGYEPYLVKTRDGDVLSGVINQQTADAIYLVTGPRDVKRIARSNIVDLRQGTVSIMPQGFDTQLTGQELADLIAFLGSLK